VCSVVKSFPPSFSHLLTVGRPPKQGDFAFFIDGKEEGGDFRAYADKAHPVAAAFRYGRDLQHPCDVPERLQMAKCPAMRAELNMVMALWRQHALLIPAAQARVQAWAHPAAAAEKLRLELDEARAQRQKDGETKQARDDRVAKRSAATAEHEYYVTVHYDDAALSVCATPVSADVSASPVMPKVKPKPFKKLKQ
jgi:hypothetical protein